MQPSLCSKHYTANEQTANRDRTNPRWESLLPRDWRNQVVAPVKFRTFRDYEMAAEHILGTDGDGFGLKVGVRACALIKASHIILAVNS